MLTLSGILIIFVAILHLYFMILEMFLWTKPRGMKAFGLESREFAEKTKVLAANQGLYNGFLVAGLIYALINNNQNLMQFFLICVILAGTFGWYSTRKFKLLLVQALPAIIALITLYIANNF